MEIGGWWEGLLQTAMGRVEQPLAITGKELQQQARPLCQVEAALELQPRAEAHWGLWRRSYTRA